MAHILIATPALGGVVTTQYVVSVWGAISALRARGVGVGHYFAESTLVCRARNAYATAVLTEPSFTHLLFVDSDMGFRPEAVLRMLDLDRPFVGCVYPYRSMDFGRFHAVSREIEDPKLARDVAQNYVNSDRLVGGAVEKGFARIERLGMGLTLLGREVLERLSEGYPDLWGASDAGYRSMGVGEGVFQPFEGYRTESGLYLSEDMSFCRRWTELGGEIWACLDETVSHVGPATFSGNFLARARFEQGREKA